MQHRSLLICANNVDQRHRAFCSLPPASPSAVTMGRNDSSTQRRTSFARCRPPAIAMIYLGPISSHLLFIWPISLQSIFRCEIFTRSPGHLQLDGGGSTREHLRRASASIYGRSSASSVKLSQDVPDRLRAVVVPLQYCRRTESSNLLLHSPLV